MDSFVYLCSLQKTYKHWLHSGTSLENPHTKKVKILLFFVIFKQITVSLSNPNREDSAVFLVYVLMTLRPIRTEISPVKTIKRGYRPQWAHYLI